MTEQIERVARAIAPMLTRKFDDLPRDRAHDRRICQNLEVGYAAATVTLCQDDILQAAQAAIEAANSSVNAPTGEWKHIKSGGVYKIQGICQLEHNNTRAFLYRSVEGGPLWAREMSEFLDGRFVKLDTTPPTEKEEASL